MEVGDEAVDGGEVDVSVARGHVHRAVGLVAGAPEEEPVVGSDDVESESGPGAGDVCARECNICVNAEIG